MSNFIRIEFTKPSSNIDMATHDVEQGLLRVRFKGGRVYEYRDISLSMAEDMGEAGSAGAWFSAQIAKYPKEYPATRMDADCNMLEEIEEPEVE